MTDYEEEDELHFACSCLSNFEDNVGKHAQMIAEDPGFSLAHFAYNLAGSYFGKSVNIRFRGCRYLKLVLDHMELSRIGSAFFRPDIQFRGLVLEEVYHLELSRNPPPTATRPFPDEYLIAFPSESLMINLESVAIVKLDAGAKFNSLLCASPNSRLYIDLNQGILGQEDDLNIHGFNLENIYFITKNRRVQMQKGEDFHAKMKELAVSMSSPSSFQLSFALMAFALVIFLGIVGLTVVVIHRQKKKKQLKALLRAKNLGPVLESREIARTTGIKHYPQYAKTSPPPPPVEVKKTAMPADAVLVQSEVATSSAEDKKWRKLDINDLLAGIMLRIRKNEARFPPPGATPTQETSFYYKESSVSSREASSRVVNQDVAVQVHAKNASSGSECSSADTSVSRLMFVNPRMVKHQYDIKSKFARFFSTVSYPYKSRTNTKL